jgi:hypothetical protein
MIVEQRKDLDHSVGLDPIDPSRVADELLGVFLRDCWATGRYPERGPRHAVNAGPGLVMTSERRHDEIEERAVRVGSYRIIGHDPAEDWVVVEGRREGGTHGVRVGWFGFTRAGDYGLQDSHRFSTVG